MPAEMKWHPFADVFPPIEGAEWEAFKEDVRQSGGNIESVKYRLVGGRKEGLDGKNRTRACKELGLPCMMEEVYVPDDEVKGFILRRNIHRWHMTAEVRRKVVAALREEGKSTREIAGTVGVSPATVHADIAANESAKPSGVQNRTPGTNGKVSGKDGKSYPATQARKLCDRCERIAPGKGVKGCPACRDLNRKAAKGKKAVKGKKATDAADEYPKDAFGNPIPARCRDAYNDPWIQEAVDFLGVTVARFWEQRLADNMKKRQKHYPFFNAKDFIDAAASAGNFMEQMLEHLKDNRPAGVCPACNGAACAKCKMSGLVPRALYEKLTAKAGAAK
jgi:lambda repressor-like predicted transcriptional regulator